MIGTDERDTSRRGASGAPYPAPTSAGRRHADAVFVARVAAAVAAATLVVLMVGGYLMGWGWTGFGDNDHLWDYLQLLVLPVVLAALPIWLRTHHAAGGRWRALIGGVLVVSAVLLVGGYGLGWEWTGFASKTLWDWLDLLILPVVLSTMPLWLETHQRLESRWIAVLSTALAGFAIVVFGGYGLGWSWTGFEGNTVWDWLHLLLVPFALPAALTWYQVSLRRARDRNQEGAAIPGAVPGAVPGSVPGVGLGPEPHGTAEAT